MKAITLWQPWATFVAHELKTEETRAWDTSYRGWLAIHAAKTFPDWVRGLCRENPFADWLDKLGYTVDTLPRGVVVCRVKLRYTIRVTDFYRTTDRNRQLGDYTPDRFVWLLADVERYDPPIVARGHQGLWNWDESEGQQRRLL